MSSGILTIFNDTFQLRLDFDQFVISGPSTQGGVATSNLDVENGLISFSPATACLTDTFAVSNGDGIAPPTICGTNTGEHSM